MAMIEIRDVSKWYGTVQVLKKCSTEIATGEVVVVCGPSGSGKSTLIKCVNGLEPFEEGTIIVDGISVGDPKTNLPKLRAHRHGVPAFRAVPPPHRYTQPVAGAGQGARTLGRGGERERDAPARPRRHARARAQIPRPAVWRSAATRRHC